MIYCVILLTASFHSDDEVSQKNDNSVIQEHVHLHAKHNSIKTDLLSIV